MVSEEYVMFEQLTGLPEKHLIVGIDGIGVKGVDGEKSPMGTLCDIGVRYFLLNPKNVGWEFCSKLVHGFQFNNQLNWVADARLGYKINKGTDADHITRNIRNFKELTNIHQPIGITVDLCAMDIEAIKAAQKAAEPIKLLGMIALDSINKKSAITYNSELHGEAALQLAKHAVEVGLSGVICSLVEVGMLRDDSDTKNLKRWAVVKYKDITDTKDPAHTYIQIANGIH